MEAKSFSKSTYWSTPNWTCLGRKRVTCDLVCATCRIWNTRELYDQKPLILCSRFAVSYHITSTSALVPTLANHTISKMQMFLVFNCPSSERKQFDNGQLTYTPWTTVTFFQASLHCHLDLTNKMSTKRDKGTASSLVHSFIWHHSLLRECIPLQITSPQWTLARTTGEPSQYSRGPYKR